jgi:hypothetical protein
MASDTFSSICNFGQEHGICQPWASGAHVDQHPVDQHPVEDLAQTTNHTHTQRAPEQGRDVEVMQSNVV